MSPASRSAGPLILLALAVIAADQASKYAVDRMMVPGSSHVIVPGMLNLVRTSNPGVAFGLFAESPMPWRAPVLIVFSAAVIGLIVWLLATGRAGGWPGRTGMTLILGGAIGNVLDRVLRHSVTDFIDFYIGTHHWYTFNLADSAIVVGAGLVILELLRDWRHPTHERA
ncbi:MAG TPA: signal peptidase II [Candidatus Baltobacteraceae bacterium]|jgi:signal peptidase II|nr:signal peptidase II [Candidatus Baltobacteraceae bacterium]